MTDKAKEQERFYEGGCAHALKFGELCNKCTTELRAALASRPAETPRETCKVHVTRESTPIPCFYNSDRAYSTGPCGKRLPCADHPAVTVTHTTIPPDGRVLACIPDCPRVGSTPAVTPLQAPTDEGWGERVRFTTDDCDMDDHELVISFGGNGDWYVAVARKGEAGIYGVRIATSGQRVPGLANAIADAYRAIRSGKRAVINARSRATAAPSDPQPEKCCRVARGRVCQNIKPCAEHPSDPQSSEQEEDDAFADWFTEWFIRERRRQTLSYLRAARAGRECERNHRPAIDIEDIIKHCRLSLDAKSVSLPELRKALQKATAR